MDTSLSGAINHLTRVQVPSDPQTKDHLAFLLRSCSYQLTLSPSSSHISFPESQGCEPYRSPPEASIEMLVSLVREHCSEQTLIRSCDPEQTGLHEIHSEAFILPLAVLVWLSRTINDMRILRQLLRLSIPGSDKRTFLTAGLLDKPKRRPDFFDTGYTLLAAFLILGALYGLHWLGCRGDA